MYKKIILCFTVILFARFLNASDFSDYLDKANSLYVQEDFEGSKKNLNSALKLIESRIKDNSKQTIQEKCGYCGKACDPTLGDFPEVDKYKERSVERFLAFFKASSSDYIYFTNMQLYNIYNNSFWLFKDSDGNVITVWMEDHHCKEYVMDKYEKNKKTTFTLYGTPFNHFHGHVLNIDRIE